MPRSRPPYPPEFRREAIRLVRASDEEHPIPNKVAKELGATAEMLGNWLKQAEVDVGEWEGLSTEDPDGACGGHPGDGCVEEAGHRARPPFGSQRAVHGPFFRQTLAKCGHRALDGSSWFGPGQRHLRELRRDAEGRAHPSTSLPPSRGGEERHLRVRGGFLQPQTSALFTRIPKPPELRGGWNGRSCPDVAQECPRNRSNSNSPFSLGG